MRKVLLFLLFFGAGLTVLWYFRAQRESTKPVGPERVEGSVKPEQMTVVVPRGGEPGGAAGQVGVMLGGSFDGTKFSGEGDTRKRLYTIHSDDVRPLGNDVYDLHQLAIDVYTPGTEGLRVHLVSPLSRVRVTLRNGQPEIGENDRVYLTDAEVTLHEGSPVVPLTMRVPLLEWQVSTGRFSSKDHVEIRGTGLQAEGTGLDLDTRTSVLRLERDGIIDIAMTPDRGATLAATKSGPIVVRRIETPGEPEVDITASDGARLAFSDVPAVPANAAKVQKIQVNADHIHLRGHASAKDHKDFDLTAADAEGSVVADSPTEKLQADRAVFVLGPTSRLQRADFTGHVAMHRGEEAFWSDEAQFTFGPEVEIVRAELQGHVDLDRGADHFHSQRAVFRFGPKGELAQAELSGEPNGSINIADYLPPDTSPGAARELRAAQASIRGVGPLTLAFVEGTELDMPGPGEITIPELQFVLRAQRSLHGTLDAERKHGRLVADGSSRVLYKGSDLESDSIEMRYTLLRPGEEIVDLYTSGWTIAHLTTVDRGEIEVQALDGLQVQSKDRRLTLPIARGATVKAPGPRGFEARADLMRDVDWQAQRFNAQGHVIFDDEQGNGTAAIAIARGRDDISLFGIEGEPARYRLWREPRIERLAGASVEAHEIHLRGQVIESSGDVKGIVEEAHKRYRVESDQLRLELHPPLDLLDNPARPFHAVAEGRVRTRFTSEGDESSLSCNKLTIDGVLKSPKKKLDGAELDSSDLRAEGDVKVQYNAAGGWSGEGDLLTFDKHHHGRLSSGAGRRIHAVWRGAPDGYPYALEADWIDFDRERVEASHVEVKESAAVPAPPSLQALPAQVGAGPLLTEMRADHFEADDHHVLLAGRAHARGRTLEGETWAVDAGSIRVLGKWKNQKPLTTRDLESIEAWQGFTAEFGSRARAQGERLFADGRHVRVEGTPARMVLPIFECRSAWIEYDIATMLISTAKGDLLPSPGSKEKDWSLSYSALYPVEQPDNTIMVLRDPVLRRAEMEARAGWLMFWIDRDEWQQHGDRVMHKQSTNPELRITEPETPPPATKPKDESLKDKFTRLRTKPFARVLSEAYLEGNVEFFQAGECMARASSVYLDLKEARGWVQDADIFVDVFVRDQKQRLRAMAQWMRIQTDLSLRADKARITACDFAVPHYVVETGDLEITPGENPRELAWDVSARNNSLRLESGLGVPLPPISYPANKKGQPLIDQFVLGDSAQFGASVRTAFNVPLGKVGTGFGKVFEKIFSLPETDLEGHWKFDAGFLGLRGVLLGAGVVYSVKDQFRLEMELSGIPDSGEDRGLVRVPTDERNLLRDWFRLRSRYNFDKDQWLDFAISDQSDPGVQSEFYERDYLYYEQKDNYVHWRKAQNQYYYDASVKVLLEDRTDEAELPKLFAGRGRTPIGELWSTPVLYTFFADAAYLQRQNGNPEFYPQFPDGFGDRDVARVDTEHRLEMSFPLGWEGVRMTPFTAVRATAWSQASSGAESPTRLGFFAGADFATTYWKRFSNGYMNTISPSISFHGDFASTETSPGPVQFDQVEDPILGKFVDFTLRTRIWKPTSQQQMDFEVRTRYGYDVGPTQPDGLQPIAIVGDFLTQVAGVPVAFTQDATYDVLDGHTLYSNTAFGFEPHPRFDIETGYHRGDSTTSTGAFVAELFEAASIGMRYKLSAKWEVQFDEWISLNDNTGFAHDFVVRRIGHDFVLDLGINVREGQGAGFGFKFTPRFSWKRPSMGLMDRFFGVNR